MRRTKANAEQTRADIILAAEHLFLANGVAHTSLEQVARAAGVTRGAVYWHFNNKAHLFNEILNQIRLPSEQLAEQIGLCSNDSSARTLCNEVVDAFKRLSENERKRRIFTILLRRCEFTDDIREAEIRHEVFINTFIDLCTQLFARLEQQDQLREGITARRAALAVHAMLVGALHDWLRDPEILDLHEDINHMFNALFKGMVKNWD